MNWSWDSEETSAELMLRIIRTRMEVILGLQMERNDVLNVSKNIAQNAYRAVTDVVGFDVVDSEFHDLMGVPIELFTITLYTSDGASVFFMPFGNLVHTVKNGKYEKRFM